MPIDTTISDNAVAEFANQVEHVNVARKQYSSRPLADGTGKCVYYDMTCDVLKYAPGIDTPFIETGVTFHLVVRYDTDGNEVSAFASGVNGQKPPCSQEDPADVVPTVTKIRKLIGYMDAREDTESWRLVGPADVGQGAIAAKVLVTDADGNETAVIIAQDSPGIEGVFEIATVE
tara:strand:+ start:5661 stop:6185 length:525 start_codon:yes stop_codon:yes gene_type:complete